jgi:hypothetical protein
MRSRAAADWRLSGERGALECLGCMCAGRIGVGGPARSALVCDSRCTSATVTKACLVSFLSVHLGFTIETRSLWTLPPLDGSSFFLPAQAYARRRTRLERQRSLVFQRD